jgi:hypothetical protein
VQLLLSSQSVLETQQLAVGALIHALALQVSVVQGLVSSQSVFTEQQPGIRLFWQTLFTQASVVQGSESRQSEFTTHAKLSTVHVAEHPSPLTVLPSSHSSGAQTTPSPQPVHSVGQTPHSEGALQTPLLLQVEAF